MTEFPFVHGDLGIISIEGKQDKDVLAGDQNKTVICVRLSFEFQDLGSARKFVGNNNDNMKKKRLQNQYNSNNIHKQIIVHFRFFSFFLVVRFTAARFLAFVSPVCSGENNCFVHPNKSILTTVFFNW